MQNSLKKMLLNKNGFKHITFLGDKKKDLPGSIAKYAMLLEEFKIEV
ncbi:hypothetical protein [Borreliella lusitaniae]